jgi:signal peptidase I
MANEEKSPSRGSAGSGYGRPRETPADALGPISDEYTYAPPVTEGAGFEAGVTGTTTPEIESVAAPTAKPRKQGMGATREIIETLMLAFVIFVGVRALVLNFRVDGTSMTPNMADSEMLLVNRNLYFHFDLNGLLDRLPLVEREGARVVYPFHPPERGDIIVFDPPTVSEKPYIKRVIGLPGETVTIENGAVFINGEKLEEPYLEEGITECTRSRCDPVRVGEGEVYVLGDNRRNSSDSRIFGAVSVDNIIGKAWLTYWPFGEFGLVPHYDYE